MHLYSYFVSDFIENKGHIYASTYSTSEKNVHKTLLPEYINKIISHHSLTRITGV